MRWHSTENVYNRAFSTAVIKSSAIFEQSTSSSILYRVSQVTGYSSPPFPFHHSCITFSQRRSMLLSSLSNVSKEFGSKLICRPIFLHFALTLAANLNFCFLPASSFHLKPLIRKRISSGSLRGVGVGCGGRMVVDVGRRGDSRKDYILSSKVLWNP